MGSRTTIAVHPKLAVPMPNWPSNTKLGVFIHHITSGVHSPLGPHTSCSIYPFEPHYVGIGQFASDLVLDLSYPEIGRLQFAIGLSPRIGPVATMSLNSSTSRKDQFCRESPLHQRFLLCRVGFLMEIGMGPHACGGLKISKHTQSLGTIKNLFQIQ